MFRVLTLSMGSTSTKLAVYEDSTVVLSLNIPHTTEDLSAFPSPMDQYAMRKERIVKALAERYLEPSGFHAVSSVGGPLKPMPGGVYVVNDKMVEDIRSGNVYAQHAVHLGALVGREMSKAYGIPAFIVDPITTDEFRPLARVSGLRGVPRNSQAHALNVKAVARRVSRKIGKPFATMSAVVAHLGGGSSVCAVVGGRIVDAATSRQDGPFSSEAAGGMPMPDYLDYLLSQPVDKAAAKAPWFGKGGLVSQLGTNDIAEIEKRIAGGDEEAALVLEAMAYTVAKSLGAMAVAIGNSPDAIIITGGAARSSMVVEWVKQRVGFLGVVFVEPGEDEMAALAEGAIRVLSGEEKAAEYL